MTKRDEKTVKKLLHHIALIQQYMTLVSSADDFKHNTLVQDAVVFNLLQLGELAKNQLTDAFKSKHNSISWINIYGLRNRIVHDYYNVQIKTLYNIIQHDLQELNKNMNHALSNEL